MTRTALDRYADLERKAVELEATATRPRSPATARENGSGAVASPAPTMAHRQVVSLLDELLSLVNPDEAGPFGFMLRSLRRLEGVLLRDFAEVPEEAVIGFCREVGRRMMSVGAIPAETLERTDPAALPAPAGDGTSQDQPPGA